MLERVKPAAWWVWLLAAGCASAVPGPLPSAAHEVGDLAGVLRSAIEYLEQHHGRLVLLAGKDLEPRVERLLPRLREVTTREQLPISERYSFPPGVLELRQVAIGDGTARVDCFLGPVPITPPGHLIADCGTTYRLFLRRSEGPTWSIDRLTITVC